MQTGETALNMVPTGRADRIPQTWQSLCLMCSAAEEPHWQRRISNEDHHDLGNLVTVKMEFGRISNTRAS